MLKRQRICLVSGGEWGIAKPTAGCGAGGMATEDGKSDDGEDVELAERTSHIAYGEAEAGEGAARAAIEAGIEAGNIALQAPDAKMELSEASQKVRAAQEARLAEMELARRMKALAVPTDDARVREMLRSLQQPVTLFAERQMERRERLRRLLAEKQATGEQVPLAVGEMEVEEEVVVRPTEKFYTPGAPGLRPARCTMALWSLARARTRIAVAKRRRDDTTTKGEEREAWLCRAKATGNECSEFADSRPIQGVALSQCGTWLATASWSGLVKLWALEGTQCTPVATIRAHDERCTGVDWRPQAASLVDEEDGPCSSSSSSSLSLATASADGTARLWASSGKLLRVLQGHEQRLARCRFHPMGCFLGTSSFDGSWRLWDLQAGQSLSVHEGHSRAAYALAFHPDGSLAVSGGLDSIARVWDCRSGRSVITLQGHVRGVLATDFSPNGYVVATGSEDNTCRIWDLRRKCCVYTIPSHRKLVTQVRFEPHSGHFLATASHDRAVRLWSARDWKLQCTLAGHEEKVMDMAVDPQGTGLIASVSYDRVLKLWAPSEDHALLELGPSSAQPDVQDALPLSDTAAAADMDTEQPLPPPPGPPPTSASAPDDG